MPTPSHKKALSPQSAWSLPQLTVHPAHPSARLGTWTFRVTTVLMGSGGITPEATLRGSGPAPHTDPACLVTKKKIQVGGAPGAPRESSKTRALGAHQEGHPRGTGGQGRLVGGGGAPSWQAGGRIFVAESIGPGRREQEELMQTHWCSCCSLGHK